MRRQRKDLKVYREEVKERFTPHWDLDYLSTAELEAVMAGGHRGGRPKQASAHRGIDGLMTVLRRVFPFRLRQRA